MLSYYPDLRLIESARVRTPLEMRQVSLAVLYVVDTDPASLELLESVQMRSKGNVIDYPDLPPLEGGSDPWFRSMLPARTIARRLGIQQLYVVRDKLSKAILAEAKMRGIVKPYNVFAVWFLFAAKHELPVNDKEYIYAMGKMMVEARALAFGNTMIQQDAESICNAIEEIEESVAARNSLRDSV